MEISWVLLLIATGVLYLTFKLGERKGVKGMNEMKGGKRVVLSNGKHILLTLDNKEQDIFNCYMNLKKSKVEEEIANSKLLKLNNYQKEILYWISDGIHNIGSESHQKELGYNKKEFKKNIGRFFSITRVLADNLKDERYDKSEMNEILEFIKDDFGSYCHYLTKELDLDRYTALVNRN